MVQARCGILLVRRALQARHGRETEMRGKWLAWSGTEVAGQPRAVQHAMPTRWVACGCLRFPSPKLHCDVLLWARAPTRDGMPATHLHDTSLQTREPEARRSRRRKPLLTKSFRPKIPNRDPSHAHGVTGMDTCSPRVCVDYGWWYQIQHPTWGRPNGRIRSVVAPTFAAKVEPFLRVCEMDFATCPH